MITVSRNGKSFNVSDSFHQEWWLKTYPVWELETSALMDKYCRPDKITIDVGSWNGVHALYMAQLSKLVYTLEPDPTAYRILKANLECNPDLASKIVALPLAISDHRGTIDIMDTGASGSSILPSMHAKHATLPIAKTPCMTFCDFIVDRGIAIEDIGFIKMDIEGAESIVIPDMEWFLKIYQGVFCLSLHPGIIDGAAIAKVVGVMNKYFVNVSDEVWVRR